MAENKDKQNHSESKKDSPNDEGKPAVQSRDKANIANFNNTYFIDLSKEMTVHSNEFVKAYATGTSQSKPEGFFTMICNPKYTPRTNITKFYKENASSTLPSIVDYGRVRMPDNSYNYCYIYKDNLGQPIHKTNSDIALGWKADKVLEVLIIPVIMALKSLQQGEITHANIRATNFYSENGKALKLGECLATPPSMAQPIVFETIERAMASPIGRGEGTIKDDLYALGVLAAMHVRNFDPLKGKSDDEIISAKVVNGSYGALIGSSDRVPSGISGLIRGLLYDSVNARWSLDEVMDYLDGRRQNPKQSVKMKKAARAVKFDGTDFFYARTLAHRMMKKQQEAVAIIESHELAHWIERSLDNTELTDRYKTALENAEEGGIGVGYWDRLLPRISTALDPYAPIRYRSLSLHINAIGNALAEAFAEKKGLSNFIDLFNNGIIYNWIIIQHDLKNDVNSHLQTLDKIKGFLRLTGLTNGIERCLYFLNPSIHCFSPLVEDYFATDTVEYLIALNDVAEKNKGKHPEKIIDKHAACFLMARDQKLIEPYVAEISSNEQFRYIIGNLNIFAFLQKFNDVGPLPHLSNWICDLLDPVIERYHDKEMQEEIRQKIAKKRETGILSDILTCVENSDKIKKDQQGFRRAIIQYKELDLEMMQIGQKLKKPKFFAERIGREWAATISGVISTIIIVGFIIVHFGGGK